ncbi:unnamed protein product [Clonostachys solani]|uniref:MGAT4 conserved region domain-containing protein n=1 Tax=Clonostachys solani TaxID=160281 RepID=A0A9N9W360_9HYPO|nr:unnamed protein product [Clonostachys solani]
MALLSALKRFSSARPPLVDVALAALWLILCQLAALYSWRDPGSFFFDSEKAAKPLYSAIRESEADEFIQKALNASATSQQPDLQHERHPNSPYLDSYSAARICAGIPTKGREKEQFLPRTIASLVDTLSPEERKSLHIIILITEENPEANPAFGQSWLSNMADEVLLYSPVPKYLNPDTYKYIDENKPSKSAERNEHVQMDYATLMETCQKQGADYFLLVEDDIIASRDWLSKLNSALHLLEALPVPNDWLYLRLFYTELYLGWNGEEWHIYIPRILLVYALVGGILLLGRALRGRYTKKQSPCHATYIVRFHIWFIAFTALFFMAGRVTVIPRSEGIREMNNYGCCGQGLAFPAHHLDMLEEKLRAPPHHAPGDSFIEIIADEMNLKRWAMEPSVFQHVGVRGSSEKGGPRKDLWNYGFET